MTPWTAARQASLSFTISWSLLKLMSIESVTPPNLLILCCSSPPAFSLSWHQGLFQRVDSSHPVAKVLAAPLQPPPGSFLRLHSVHLLGGFLIKEIHRYLLEFCLCAQWNFLRAKAILSLCSSAPRAVKTSQPSIL